MPAAAVEGVLDRLLPMVPGGVREIACGAEVELRLRGADLPPVGDLARAAGVRRASVREHEIPDDWRARRRLDYRPLVIGGRLVVRPDWAPPASAAMGGGADVIEIVLGEGPAFGGGTHPTTEACLELLLGLAPLGPFADLGCGTGVLAILAAKLGSDPVLAVDVQPGSVAAAVANAARNGVRVDAFVSDLSVEQPPAGQTLVANLPAAVHTSIAARLAPPLPRLALLSGFGPTEAATVTAAYARRGLHARRTIERAGWTIVVVEAA
ncbi:MAG: 50S ribosomal protein L11 methyltransferase [Solirubrobacteraceae bacterium]